VALPVNDTHRRNASSALSRRKHLKGDFDEELEQPLANNTTGEPEEFQKDRCQPSGRSGGLLISFDELDVSALSCIESLSGVDVRLSNKPFNGIRATRFGR
jgi:hypothetical protein